MAFYCYELGTDSGVGMIVVDSAADFQRAYETQRSSQVDGGEVLTEVTIDTDEAGHIAVSGVQAA